MLEYWARMIHTHQRATLYVVCTRNNLSLMERISSNGRSVTEVSDFSRLSGEERSVAGAACPDPVEPGKATTYIISG